jgi:hypothetical protein
MLQHDHNVYVYDICLYVCICVRVFSLNLGWVTVSKGINRLKFSDDFIMALKSSDYEMRRDKYKAFSRMVQ